LDDRSSLGAVSKRGCFFRNARARKPTWKRRRITLFPAQVDATDAHASLAARLAAETGTRVSLAWDDLVPGETLGFAATATNYLGESTTSDVKYVAKVGSPTPKVMFQTSTTTIRRSDALTLKLDVSLPSTNCTDGNVTGALGYAWIARKWDGNLENPGWGSALPELDDDALAVYARNPSALRLPADALKAGEVYAFGVTAFYEDSQAANATAYCAVQVTTQDLEAAIAGGVERYVAAASVVSLDASASADPDNATADGPLRFAWNLTRADDGADLTANASLGDAAVVEFVADVAPGTYVAAVTVSRGDRSASAAATLVVSADAFIPEISVAAAATKFNPGAGAYGAVYFGASTPAADNRSCCDFEWSVDSPPSTDAAIFSKGATAPSPMLLDLGLVTPGDTYFFRLSATDGSGASSSAVVRVDVNAPPTSGSFAVAPRRGGFAVSTTYEFALSDWSDDADDYPLTYAFAYEDLDRDVLLVADRYATSWLTTTLPKTSALNVTCSGTVYDRLLASATGSQATEVLVAAYEASELAALADDAVGAALDAGDSESALREISSISSVIASGGDDDANTDLVSTLMAATLSAFDGVDAAASPEATAQVLGTMATLVANPGLLAPEVQMDAVGLLGTTVSNAVAAGLDGAASTSTAAALSSVLSASLFEDGGSARRRRLKAHASLDVAPNSTLASKLRRRRLAARRRLDEADGAANTTLADDMTTTVSQTAQAMIATAYGGQSSSTSSDNLAIDAWRTDCGTRSSSFGTGGGTAFAPPASATGACGDDAGDDGAGSDVDVQIAEMSNVYGEPEAKRGEETEEVKSKLVQVEMSDTGDDGRRRRLTAFGDDDPITLVIQFQEPDFALVADQSALARNGTCANTSQTLVWDNCPDGGAVRFNCSDPQVVTFPDGSNGTFYAPPLGAAPLAVSATCPSKAPLCTFWDDASQAWSGANCTVANFTAFNVTCACTHLTDFAGGASSTASTASAVVSTGASLSLSQLLDALLVLIVLLAVGGGFLFGCVRAHQLDEEDEVRGKYTRDHHAHEAGVKASGPLELTGNKASFLAAAKRARTHRGWISRRSARKSTAGLGRPDQTLKLSSSVNSESIRLIFGRINCSRRVLEAQWKRSCQNIRIRSHRSRVEDLSSTQAEPGRLRVLRGLRAAAAPGVPGGRRVLRDGDPPRAQAAPDRLPAGPGAVARDARDAARGAHLRGALRERVLGHAGPRGDVEAALARGRARAQDVLLGADDDAHQRLLPVLWRGLRRVRAAVAPRGPLPPPRRRRRGARRVDEAPPRAPARGRHRHGPRGLREAQGRARVPGARGLRRRRPRRRRDAPRRGGAARGAEPRGAARARRRLRAEAPGARRRGARRRRGRAREARPRRAPRLRRRPPAPRGGRGGAPPADGAPRGRRPLRRAAPGGAAHRRRRRARRFDARRAGALRRRGGGAREDALVLPGALPGPPLAPQGRARHGPATAARAAALVRDGRLRRRGALLPRVHVVRLHVQRAPQRVLPVRPRRGHGDVRRARGRRLQLRRRREPLRVLRRRVRGRGVAVGAGQG